MEPAPIEDDALSAGISCYCLSGNVAIPQARSIEYPTEDGAPPSSKQSGLKLKQRLSPAVVPSTLVKGSKFLKARIAGRGGDRPSSRSPPRSAAHRHFDNNAGGGGSRSPRSVTSLKSHPGLRTMDSLVSDEDEGCDADDDDDAATSESVTCSECSAPSPEEQLALDIGQNAREYLEECFYTEASILCRDKFDAIPQICMDDYTVMNHLGKGNFSDVHHVVRADGMPSGDLGNGMAVKSLRPQVMADEEQFEIGSEDLIHETALLANLRHRHIIKLHGRRSGPLEEGFVNGSYFIFLDKLVETLPGRMAEWKQDRGAVHHGPSVEQLEVAHAIADAMTYLHSKDIVFRDLKPDNVGFDLAGELKLFDFGFAIGLPERDESNPAGYLYDRCGTPRYMAPEVGFSMGYDERADVYSFGVLLWEMCALEKPFAMIRTSEQFDRMVLMGGMRPSLGLRWPREVTDMIGDCWAAPPGKRPSMAGVKSALWTAIGHGPRSKRRIR